MSDGPALGGRDKGRPVMGAAGERDAGGTGSYSVGVTLMGGVGDKQQIGSVVSHLDTV